MDNTIKLFGRTLVQTKLNESNIQSDSDSSKLVRLEHKMKLGKLEMSQTDIEKYFLPLLLKNSLV